MKKNKKILIVAHGDFDGIASAVLLANALGGSKLQVIFTQPYGVDHLDFPKHIDEVYVVDIAVNNRDVEMTRRFIAQLGNKLKKWYDHHKGWSTLLSSLSFKEKEKIIVDESAPCCADLIPRGGTLLSPERERQIRADARATDTRQGKLSPQGELIENACKADLFDDSIRAAAASWLLGNESKRPILEAAAKKYAAIQKNTMRLASTYKVEGKVAVVDTRGENPGTFDLTQLLLEGQKKAPFAIVIHWTYCEWKDVEEEEITVATQSGVNLVELFHLPSGAPSRVSLPASRLEEVIKKLNSL